MFRAEKTPQGMKGVYLSLTDGDFATQRIALDAQGQIVQREPLRSAAGRCASRRRPIRMRPRVAAAGVAVPEVNSGDEAASSTSRHQSQGRRLEPGRDFSRREHPAPVPQRRRRTDRGGRRGRVRTIRAAGVVRRRHRRGAFQGRRVQGLLHQDAVKEELSSHFRMQRLSDFYYAWGAGAADFNHDGVLDVVAGPHIFLGPDYTRRREIYLQVASNPSDEYTMDCWMQFVDDFTGDGWADVITAAFLAVDPIPGAERCVLYVNPKGRVAPVGQASRRAGVQQRRLRSCDDLDGDGKSELVYGAKAQMRYAKPNPANPTGRGSFATSRSRGLRLRTASAPATSTATGACDIVNPNGWWEQPAAGSTQEPWTYHPQAFGRYGREHRRRQRHGRLRRERRQAERCGDGPESARLGPGVVRAEARCAGRDFVRAAHDHGRLCGRRTRAA